ncbi:DUF2510 domain-containing protein [Demequina sp. NBRC 110056]|uniref:DUF2510 domain-containing protein n=1 Tax=Demequina sp. NBRC 110056 TaxID=1570345 RepID=UPI000A052455|nr:DUF2510 domain-containing protein [Demequina sp. NBRC 110056]
MTEFAAGWYADPSSPAHLRYWDGAAWTQHVTPHPSVPPPPPATSVASEDYGPGSPLHYLVPVGRSGLAIAAPWIGLAALVMCWAPVIGLALGVLAIVISIMALRRARDGGHGTGRAVVGIVLGGIGAIIGLITTGGLVSFLLTS